MSLTRTTASSVSQTDTEITLANTSGLSMGDTLKVEDEYMRVLAIGPSPKPLTVYRGANGTNAVTHAAGATAVFGAPYDPFGPNNSVGTRLRDTSSYAASGAIEPAAKVGRDRLVFLTGTAVQAMTLPAPPVSADGDLLIIVGTNKLAHTIVTSQPIAGGATLATLTLDAAALCSVSLMALGGFWVPFPSPVSGTLTSIDVGAT